MTLSSKVGLEACTMQSRLRFFADQNGFPSAQPRTAQAKQRKQKSQCMTTNQQSRWRQHTATAAQTSTENQQHETRFSQIGMDFQVPRQERRKQNSASKSHRAGTTTNQQSQCRQHTATVQTSTSSHTSPDSIRARADLIGVEKESVAGAEISAGCC